MDDLEARIRERAFHLWEAAGCPENRAEEFWIRARDAELGTPFPAETGTGDPATDPAKFAGF